MYYLLLAILAAINVVIFVDHPEGNWLSPLTVGFIAGMAVASALLNWQMRKIRR